MTDEAKGFLLGFVGMAIFALTLPMTRLAVADMTPGFLTFGRGTLAALLSIAALTILRQRWPGRDLLWPIMRASAGVVFGFPLFMSWAMLHVPAIHGAVVLGVLPLATAVAGALVDGDRPSPTFWAVAVLGSLAVIAFALLEGGLALQLADLALLGAVSSAAYGYAEGVRISRRLGSWQTICWLLVAALPLLLIGLYWEARDGLPQASLTAWGGFAYNALFSQFIGFFAWYRGLALGGVARVGQVQLLQTFITIGFSALVIGEVLDARTLLFAFVVAGLVWVGRKAPIRKAAR